jgi:TATA-box binding protein (TBP) (component of TFIID and TFIIIB)
MENQTLSTNTFPNFDDIKVSTKTFIVTSNLDININNLFEQLPVTEYEVVPKRRGRKKKSSIPDPNQNIKDGSIITLEHEGKIRGVDLKKKRSKKKNRGNYFRNSVTIVMTMPDNKKINFKVSRNGKFQMTGCKIDSHAVKCIEYMWNYMKEMKDVYTINGDCFKVIFIPAMRNIDFSLGFLVNRETLDMYINEETEYHSLLETSFGYTGVNIKIPVVTPVEELKYNKFECDSCGKWIQKTVTYQEYIDELPEKEKEKKLNKERFNTFLVFHSGKIIMSGTEADVMRPTYYQFIDIIKKCHSLIEEKLEKD